MKNSVIAILLGLVFIVQPVSASNIQQILQLLDYIGVDYEGAVEDGRIINPVEYQEMLDFSQGVKQQLADLPDKPGKASLLSQADTLIQRVKLKESADSIKQITGQMRDTMITAYSVAVIPFKQPDLQQAARLYQKLCVSCHGVTGKGDGDKAINMSPPPIDFTDIARYKERTLYGLYNTITHGVAGTAMPAFTQLTEQQRWSLAFYVGSLAQGTDKKMAVDVVKRSPLADITTLTTTTPAEAVQRYGEAGRIAMATLRSHPELAFETQSKIAFAKQKLDAALHSYRQGKNKQAYQYAIEAYLDGYELVEQNLDTLDHGLRLEIEQAMTTLRNQIRTGASASHIEALVMQIKQQLAQAEAVLNSKSLTGVGAFSSALFILLREGLEAILIVAALMAFLIRTRRKDALRYLHMGWIAAVVLGVITWWASVKLVTISGASREITEGLGAVVATIVLVYVGFWMHDKTSAAKWKQFIDHNMQKALSSNTLWALSGLSFIAVYREIFETILFYQALWTQTDYRGQGMVISGMITALIVLVGAAWLITRYSVRLPLRQFFSITSGLMFVLAFIFAGKGVAALQEAGWIIHTPIAIPSIDWLGIYPNLQGVLVQLCLLALMIFFLRRKG